MGPSLFSPKRKSPRKLDSRKNENTPSMARVWPITPPAACGECGPVGAELELHGDAGDDSEGEVDAENARPESRGAVEMFVAGADEFRFQIEDEQREAHGQLRKNVVERDGEGEMQAMNG